MIFIHATCLFNLADYVNRGLPPNGGTLLGYVKDGDKHLCMAVETPELYDMYGYTVLGTWNGNEVNRLITVDEDMNIDCVEQWDVYVSDIELVSTQTTTTRGEGKDEDDYGRISLLESRLKAVGILKGLIPEAGDEEDNGVDNNNNNNSKKTEAVVDRDVVKLCDKLGKRLSVPQRARVEEAIAAVLSMYAKMS